MTAKTKHHKAFTLMELIFVIVIMAILAKFGIEFLAQAYNSFTNSKINNRLQSNSTTAIEFIASRLQYRIKASTIAREDDAHGGGFTMLKEYSSTTAPILEWVGYDVDGFRGTTMPYWSGIIDLDPSKTNINKLTSPKTNTKKLNNMLKALSSSDINDIAIYFVNPDSLDDNWGWDGDASRFNTQFGTPATHPNAIHPVRQNSANLSEFIPVDSAGGDNNFSGVEAYEFYQLAWSAYAVGIDDYNTTDGKNSGNLTFWYDYQPWRGESRADARSSIIMHNVSSFRFIARGSLVKIQVCVKSLLLKDGEYSICKEKIVF